MLPKSKEQTVAQFIPAGVADSQAKDHRDWFEQRRDFFVRRLYDDFFTILRSFQDLYQVYLSCRKGADGVCVDLLDEQNEKLRTCIWDMLTAMVGTELEKGPLWQLKDLCHRVWPKAEYASNLEGSLIDWLVGSIFHEAMKLKENIYILNSYGPAAFRISGPPAGDEQDCRWLEVPAPRLAKIMDVKGIIRRIVEDVINQMDQLSFLFGQANYMLRVMVPSLSYNMLVTRFLIEQEEVVRQLWGEEVADVFMDMFYGAAEQGFCAAGRSYLSGHWYDRALAMYERALAIDGYCDEAVAKVHQLKILVRQTGALLGSQNISEER